MEIMPGVFIGSGVLALMLSMITLILSQRPRISESVMKRWMISTAVAWGVTTLLVLGMALLLLAQFDL